jgi:hypothetical protein
MFCTFAWTDSLRKNSIIALQIALTLDGALVGTAGTGKGLSALTSPFSGKVS